MVAARRHAGAPVRVSVKGASGTFELEIRNWSLESLFAFLDQAGGAPSLCFEDQQREDGCSLSELVRRMDESISPGAAVVQGHAGETSGGSDGEEISPLSAKSLGSERMDASGSAPGAETSCGSDAEEIRVMSARMPDDRQVSASGSDGAEHASHPAWMVVGGADIGGISVREGESIRSQLLTERLATGSLVQEVARAGLRVHYRLIAGSGPAEGWVSRRIQGKELLVPHALPPAGAPRAVATRKPAAVLFPGEGCQYKGMLGKAPTLPAVQEMLEKATAILGFDVLELATFGPEFLLTQTKYCQPALFVTSLAAFEKLKHKAPEVVAQIGTMAGFGVGHYSALCAAGVLTFEVALKLVKERADAMHEAHALGKHMSLVIVGLKLPAVKELCERAACEEGADGVCIVAHYCWESGYSVCGTTRAMFLLKEMATEAGAQMVRILNQSVASDTPLMRPALARLSKALQEALPQMRPPSCTVWTTTGPRPFHAGADVRDIAIDLEDHLCKMVSWAPTVMSIAAAGARYAIDLSPQGFLQSMSRHIDKGRLKTYSFEIGGHRRLHRLEAALKSGMHSSR